jgi:hypothetical protein
MKADMSSSSRAPKRHIKVGMSSSQIKHIPAEIIVLDSDDHNAPVVHAKQKAHAESSNSCSDVGVVETEGMSSSSSGKRFQCGLDTLDESLHFAEFSRPKLLLIPTEHSPEDEPALVPGLGAASSTACLGNLIKIDDEWGTSNDECHGSWTGLTSPSLPPMSCITVACIL